ncbi:hypothetical protein C8R46DRAFT_920591 [Mycena filopes]|nr:hypothetical protein C8R46DRAFT_920591 [Mycena filopes]
MEEIVSPLRRAMKMLVLGKKRLPLWTPAKGGDFEQFLTDLKIPLDTAGKPDMLLHELGQLGEDASLNKRLQKLFNTASIAHQFLINTSGSGKTRLLLEGLCKHWGIYLTAKRDTLDHGSNDMGNIIDTILPDTPGFTERLSESASSDFGRALAANRNIAKNHFTYLLLARLRIFRLFLDVIQEVPSEQRQTEHEYRVRWLELQIRPYILGGGDIFEHLSSTLILELAPESILSEKSDESPPAEQPDNTPEAKFSLFVVIDEVQHAASTHFDAFRSDARDARGQLYLRPVFREMLHTWMKIVGIVTIAAGTGVDAAVLEETMSSAVAKYSRYLESHDTGAFDPTVDYVESLRTGDRSTQMGYILRFIPPQLIGTRLFAALVVRICYWLAGRFRFTSGFISELLAAEFRFAHETLNEYIFQLTSPPKRQDRTIIHTINSLFSGFYRSSDRRLFSTTFVPDSNKLSTVSQMVTRFWIRGPNMVNSNLSASEAEFVEWGFARFLPPSGKQKKPPAQLDEPMALLAFGQWLNAAFAETIYHRLATSIGDHHALHENTLENYLAFCFSGLFNYGSRRLDEIFHFPAGAPSWTAQTASLVALHRESPVHPVEESFVDWWSRPSLSLGTHAGSNQDAANWFKHLSAAPICFPPTKLGPDLFFILRLADGTRIWVAVQVKFEGTPLLRLNKLVDGVRTVTPINYYSSETAERDWLLPQLLALPNRRYDAGIYSLLRVVVSFPGEARPSRAAPPAEHPLASLNIQYLAAMTRDLEPKDFLTTIRNSPLFTGHDHIDSVDIPTGRVHKRSESELDDRPAPKRTRHSLTHHGSISGSEVYTPHASSISSVGFGRCDL